MRLTASQWYVVAVTATAWLASATLAINIAHAVYPVWLSWPAFVLAVAAAIGDGILISELRRAREETSTLRRVG